MSRCEVVVWSESTAAAASRSELTQSRIEMACADEHDTQVFDLCALSDDDVVAATSRGAVASYARAGVKRKRGRDWNRLVDADADALCVERVDDDALVVGTSEGSVCVVGEENTVTLVDGLGDQVYVAKGSLNKLFVGYDDVCSLYDGGAIISRHVFSMRGTYVMGGESRNPQRKCFVFCGDVTADGVILGLSDGSVRHWDSRADEDVLYGVCDEQIVGISALADHSVLACSSRGRCGVLDDRKCGFTATYSESTEFNCFGAAVLGDDTAIVYGSGGNARVVGADAHTITTNTTHTIYSAVFYAPDEFILGTARGVARSGF